MKPAAFGCCGWSGESVKLLTDQLAKAGFDVVHDGLKTLWQPGDDELAQAARFGRQTAGK